MSDNNIQSVLVENRSFPPPDGFARNAYHDAAELARLHEHAARDPERLQHLEAPRLDSLGHVQRPQLGQELGNHGATPLIAAPTAFSTATPITSAWSLL